MDLWSSLLQMHVDIKASGIFKAQVDRFMISPFVKGYDEKAMAWDRE